MNIKLTYEDSELYQIKDVVNKIDSFLLETGFQKVIDKPKEVT